MDTKLQQEIYNSILKLLKEYSPPFEVREGKNVSDKDSLGLWKTGEFEAFGRKRSEIYFAGVIKQKAYVGFYFMPIYAELDKMKKNISPQLLKTLKGKSCFYIKTNDPSLMTDIKHLLAEGFKLYKQLGWV